MQLFLNKILTKLKLLRYNIGTIVFHLATAVYFIYLQWGQGFADPDSFYHAKLGQLMSEGHFVLKQFPWFTFTTFTSQFTDHQFLYHLLLALFIKFFTPLVATKIVAVILAIAIFIFFDWFLKHEKIKFRYAYLAILLTTWPFVFRINLAKAGPLAIILFFAAIHALWHKKNILLFIITFLYVWTHAGWMSIGVAFLTWMLGLIILDAPKFSKLGIFTMSKKCIRMILTDKSLWAILGGITLGIIINPYFPNNVSFYWQQAVQIGLKNYQSEISVGQEWYPFSLEDLFTGLIGLWILSGSGLIIFIIHCLYGKKSTSTARALTLMKYLLHITILTGLWLVLTFKSKRYVEYLAPSIMLYSILLIEILREFNAFQFIKQHLHLHRAMYGIIFGALALYNGFNLIINSRDLHYELTQSIPWSRLEQSSNYLAKYTPVQTLIFHTNWSDSPMLFFHNTNNHYMAGLDPTFFYLFDQSLYRRWVDINIGSVHKSAKAIYDTFKTQYILVVLPQDWKLNYQLKKEPGVKALFHDDSSIVYYYTP